MRWSSWRTPSCCSPRSARGQAGGQEVVSEGSATGSAEHAGRLRQVPQRAVARGSGEAGWQSDTGDAAPAPWSVRRAVARRTLGRTFSMAAEHCGQRLSLEDLLISCAGAAEGGVGFQDTPGRRHLGAGAPGSPGRHTREPGRPAALAGSPGGAHLNGCQRQQVLLLPAQVLQRHAPAALHLAAQHRQAGVGAHTLGACGKKAGRNRAYTRLKSKRTGQRAGWGRGRVWCPEGPAAAGRETRRPDGTRRGAAARTRVPRVGAERAEGEEALGALRARVRILQRSGTAARAVRHVVHCVQRASQRQSLPARQRFGQQQAAQVLRAAHGEPPGQLWRLAGGRAGWLAGWLADRAKHPSCSTDGWLAGRRGRGARQHAPDQRDARERCRHRRRGLPARLHAQRAAAALLWALYEVHAALLHVECRQLSQALPAAGCVPALRQPVELGPREALEAHSAGVLGGAEGLQLASGVVPVPGTTGAAGRRTRGVRCVCVGGGGRGQRAVRQTRWAQTRVRSNAKAQSQRAGPKPEPDPTPKPKDLRGAGSPQQAQQHGLGWRLAPAPAPVAGIRPAGALALGPWPQAELPL